MIPVIEIFSGITLGLLLSEESKINSFKETKIDVICKNESYELLKYTISFRNLYNLAGSYTSNKYGKIGFFKENDYRVEYKL